MTWYWLAKPGIVYGNDVPALGAFLLASQGKLDLLRGLEALIGLSLVMGGACVANNLLDRRLDAAMERTRRRALPSGKVPVHAAITYSAILTLGGLLVLAGTTPLAAVCAALGWVGYVGIYGYAKRHTMHGTLIGSFAGALPPVVGYTAVTGRLDHTAVGLFITMAIWQMPHFYAIAIFRLADYRAAKLPVMPVVRGIPATKLQILGYIGLFWVAASWLITPSKTGAVYGLATSLVSVVWLGLAWRGYHAAESSDWARRLFKWSLVVLLVWSCSLAIV